MGKDNIMNIYEYKCFKFEGWRGSSAAKSKEYSYGEPEIRVLLLSMTPASGDSMAFYGLHRHGPHVHTPTQRHIHIINISTFL